MPATFFSGNKQKNGGALFVSFNSKEQSLYFRLIKQTGWNEETSKPSFAGGETFNIKFSPDEAGEIVHAVNGHGSWKFYHSFGNEVTSGSFTHYEKEFTGKDGKPVKTYGFGLTVKKGQLEVKIGFSYGAAERLSQYLQFAFDHIHSAIYSQDKKEFEDYQKSKQTQNTKPVQNVKYAEQVKNDTKTRSAPTVFKKTETKKFPTKVEEVAETVEETGETEEDVNPPEIVEEGAQEEQLNW